ncbi:hypothetical protein ACH5RR_029586 [Cinchona calisaya]|uniref:Uncharacterized protein n=1 Tax=Cinchona calisaya TaxID=153742 RepID=A0ABD2YS27_9GENT
MSRPSGPHVHSLVYSPVICIQGVPTTSLFIPDSFKLLGVLDLESINMGHSFPSRIEFLVHLRYLALSGGIDSIPVSIAKFRNLETLIVKGITGKVLIPATFLEHGKVETCPCKSSCCLQLGKQENRNFLGFK